MGPGNFCRQGTQGEGEAGTLQIDFLQLYEIFNVRLHPWDEVYGIGRLLRKWPHASLRVGSQIDEKEYLR